MKKLDEMVQSSKGRNCSRCAARTPFNASLDEVMRLRREGDIDGAVNEMLGKMRGLQLAYMDAMTP
jgi:methyl-accepting chemotaxis protein